MTPGIFYCDGRMVVDGGGRKKSSPILLKIFSDEVQVIKMCPHVGFCDVMPLSGKKSDLKFEIFEILVQIPHG